jgi:phage FluMu protein Com
MRCTACNKPLEGVQMDTGLCGQCGSVSTFYVEMSRDVAEEEPGTHLGTPNVGWFDEFIQRHHLRASWRDGLGLMAPAARERLCEQRMWEAYCDWLSLGLGHSEALRRSSGLSNRGGSNMLGWDGIEEGV